MLREAQLPGSGITTLQVWDFHHRQAFECVVFVRNTRICLREQDHVIAILGKLATRRGDET